MPGTFARINASDGIERKEVRRTICTTLCLSAVEQFM